MGEFEQWITYINQLVKEKIGELSKEELKKYKTALEIINSEENTLGIHEALGNYPEYLLKKVTKALKNYPE